MPSLGFKLGKSGYHFKFSCGFLFYIPCYFSISHGFSTRSFDSRMLTEDSWKIARRYLLSYFLIDIPATIPLPQAIKTLHRAGGNGNKLYCSGYFGNEAETNDHGFLDIVCPYYLQGRSSFDFGVFIDAHNSGILVKKFLAEVVVVFTVGSAKFEATVLSSTMRAAKMKMKWLDVEHWMDKRHEQYKWRKTIGL